MATPPPSNPINPTVPAPWSSADAAAAEALAAGKPAFAGTAAFRSAMARKALSPSSPEASDPSALAQQQPQLQPPPHDSQHPRRSSLQRIGLLASDEQAQTNTSLAQAQAQAQAVMAAARSAPLAQPGTLSPAAQAQHVALQQQIEALQAQQAALTFTPQFQSQPQQPAQPQPQPQPQQPSPPPQHQQPIGTATAAAAAGGPSDHRPSSSRSRVATAPHRRGGSQASQYAPPQESAPNPGPAPAQPVSGGGHARRHSSQSSTGAPRIGMMGPGLSRPAAGAAPSSTQFHHQRTSTDSSLPPPPGIEHHQHSLANASRFAPMGPTAPAPLNRADIADGFSPASQAAHQSLTLTFEAAAATGLTASTNTMPSAYGPMGGPRAARGHTRLGSSFSSFGGSAAGSEDLATAPAIALAQAQAHLTALHQSRAQVNQPIGTGPPSRQHGHHRSLSTDAGGAGPQRKPLFGTYLPYSAIAPLVASGAIWVGTLRINQRNRGGAYVRPASDLLQQQLLLHHASQTGGNAQSAISAALAAAGPGSGLAASVGQMPDIFISGSKDRNRALHGDVVAVELLDPQEVWSARQAKEDKKRRKENLASSSHGRSHSISSQQGPAPGHGRSHSYSHSFSDLAEVTRPGQHLGSAALASTGTGGSSQGQQQADDEVEGTQLGLPDDEADDVVGNALDGPGSGGSPTSPSAAAAASAPPPLVGHVVGIIERPSGQLYAGTLGLLRPSAAATREKQEHGRTPSLTPMPPDSRPRIVWFRPVDKRVALMAIPADQAPDEFWLDPGAEDSPFSKRLFIATLKRWPVTSLHPFGSLVEDAGAMGNLDAETIAIVRSTLGISAEEEANRRSLALPEGPQVIAGGALQPLQLTADERRSLPPPPWAIPTKEAEIRRDLRPGTPDERTVFSMGENGGAAQAEVGLSFVSGTEGQTELAVHIADVPYFVRPGSPLDHLARRRGTSTGLVQPTAKDSVAMLPPDVGSKYASIRPDEDRLALSFVFTLPLLDTQDDIPAPVLTWAGRTVVRSVGHVSWHQADAILDGANVDGVPDSVGSTLKQLGSVIDTLRTARFEGRAPDYPGGVDVPELIPEFTLDNQGLPTDARVAPRILQKGTANARQVLDQVCALANQAAAKLIGATLPDAALLCRAPPPSTRRLTATCARLERLTGYTLRCLDTPTSEHPSTPVQHAATGLDASLGPDRPLEPSAQVLQSCLVQVGKGSVAHRVALEAVLKRVLASAPAGKEGEYFSAGLADIGQFAHWVHGTAIDTHCTSPLSSYADTLVLRQVLTALATGALTGIPYTTPSPPTSASGAVTAGWDGAEVARIALQANTRLTAAQRAMGASAHLYLCLLVHDLSMRYGPVVRMATVTAVHEGSFDVLLPSWGMEKRVHADQLPLVHVAHDVPSERLTLYWDQSTDTLSFIRALGMPGVPAPTTLGEASDKQANEAALFEDAPDVRTINAQAAKDSTERSLSLALNHVAHGSVLPTDVPRCTVPWLDSPFVIENGTQKVQVPKTWGWTQGTVEHSSAGHGLQTVSILDQVPVLITVEMVKSPPVLKVYALNPFNQFATA